MVPMLTETRTGRVPVIAYVCTSDPDISDLIADYLHRYASARDWPVVDVVTDTDRRRPRDKSPGWRRALCRPQPLGWPIHWLPTRTTPAPDWCRATCASWPGVAH